MVSPLIALMRDQVAALRHFGVEAGSLNSANDPEENRRVADAVRDGRMRLLYASPERLANSNATEWLARSGVSLLAIDEAHCVSQWGHDFRPEYALLGEVRRRLGGVQTIALTATADVATRQDIMHRLFDTEPRIFIHGFDRPNLRLAMQSKDQTRRQLFAFLDKHRHESGIVYCASRNATEKLGGSAVPGGLPRDALSRRHDAGRPRQQPGHLPSGRRSRDGGDGGVRHGNRQAGRAVRRPCGAAEIHRGLLPGDRPRRPRRRAGRHADALRPRRHAAAPIADRGRAMRPKSKSASNASVSTRSWRCAKRRAAGARRCSPISARPRSRAAIAISASTAWCRSTARSRRRNCCPPSLEPASASAPSTSSAS